MEHQTNNRSEFVKKILEAIEKDLFEMKEKEKIVFEKYCYEIIRNDIILQKLKFTKINKIDVFIRFHVSAIDSENLDFLNLLICYNTKKAISRDIVYEIYNKKWLNGKRLKFILNHGDMFKISSRLIRRLLKDENLKLLDRIFEHLKFF